MDQAVWELVCAWVVGVSGCSRPREDQVADQIRAKLGGDAVRARLAILFSSSTLPSWLVGVASCLDSPTRSSKYPQCRSR